VAGCTNAILYGDASAVLNCEAALSYDATTNALGIGGSTIVTGANVGATLGSDLVTNGTFTGNATGWTLGAGGGAPDWAYASNNVTHANAGGTTALQPTTPLTVVASTVYVVTFTLSSWTAGTVTPTIGGVAGVAVGANGTFKQVITATGTGNLLLTPTTTLAATLDTVTVTSITSGTPWLRVADASIPIDFYFGTASQRNTFMGQQSGRYSTTGGSNATCYGGLSCSSLISGSPVAVGVSAQNAATNGTNNACLGNNCIGFNRSGIRNACLGDACLNGGGAQHINENTALGYFAGNGNVGDYGTYVGASTGTAGAILNGGIALGHSATLTASNQAVFGGAGANSAITTFYLGQGVTKATPGAITWTTTGGTGSNNVGAALTIAPGASTGTAVTPLSISRNLTTTTGSTVQVQTPAIVVCPSKILSTASATVQPIATITTTTTSGGAVQMFYTVTASNGTLLNVDSASAGVAWRNNAGTVTAAIGTSGETVNTVGSGTLTSSPSATVATNVVTINFTPTWTVIAPTLVTGYAVFLVNGVNTVACQ
jgi:hypothetical protein